MRESFVRLLQDPVSGEALELVPLERGTDSLGDATITEGLLYAQGRGSAFPIISGVPVMIPSAFPKAFLEKHRIAVDELAKEIRLELRHPFGRMISVFRHNGRNSFDNASIGRGVGLSPNVSTSC